VIERSSIITDKHLDFLDNLHASGVYIYDFRSSKPAIIKSFLQLLSSVLTI